MLTPISHLFTNAYLHTHFYITRYLHLLHLKKLPITILTLRHMLSISFNSFKPITTKITSLRGNLQTLVGQTGPCTLLKSQQDSRVKKKKKRIHE